MLKSVETTALEKGMCMVSGDMYKNAQTALSKKKLEAMSITGDWVNCIPGIKYYTVMKLNGF